MARCISVATKQVVTCSIITRFADGTSSTRDIKVGDVVENLRYVEKGEIKTVSGVVDAFTYRAQPYTINGGRSAKNRFGSDVKVTNIVLDASAVYDSNIITIPTREIIEDEGAENVVKVDNVASAVVELTFNYSDGISKTASIKPGDLVDAVIMNTARGRADIDGRFSVVGFIYKVINNAPVITGLTLSPIAIDKVIVASFDRIISIDEIPTAKIDDFAQISEFIRDALVDNDEAAIALTGDIEVPVRDDGRITSTFINEGKKLTVDLAGHNFTTQAYAFYVNGGELIIADSTGEGTITTTITNKAYPAINVVAGKCTMVSGNIDVRTPEMEEGDYNWTYGVVCSGEGVFEMSGGEIHTDEASPISICNGTATGEGAQFIIGGDATIISDEGPAVYNADQRTVVIQDNAVVKGGIMARLGEIVVKDNAKVTDYRVSKNVDSLGEFLPLSGSISVYGHGPIMLMAGCYSSQANSQDMSVEVLDDATIEAEVGDGIVVVPLDTKIDQNVNVTIENSNNIKVPGNTFKVYPHEELMALAEEAGVADRVNITKNSLINITVDGEHVFPVVTEPEEPEAPADSGEATP